MNHATIHSDFLYKSHYLDVLDSQIHYIDEGKGDPIIFLHGIPTSSYLWRNVIPYLSKSARCIAPDLIGMGKSGKPNIEYRVFEHIRYIEEFIKKLNLKHVTFVMHDWGSVIGFDIAMRLLQEPNKIKGLAFLEAHIRPVTDWSMVSLPIQELVAILNTPDGGYDVIMNSNYFVNKVLPNGVLRKLTDEEMEHYRAPFKAPESCKPLWQYLQDLPLGDGPQDVVELIKRYSQRLQQSTIPKLMLYAVPGFITTISTVQWARDHLPNLTLVDVGDALHYVQETNPEVIGNELLKWYKKLSQSIIGKTTSLTSS